MTRVPHPGGCYHCKYKTENCFCPGERVMCEIQKCSTPLLQDLYGDPPVTLLSSESSAKLQAWFDATSTAIDIMWPGSADAIALRELRAGLRKLIKQNTARLLDQEIGL